jgi:hypothetical protein
MREADTTTVSGVSSWAAAGMERDAKAMAASSGARVEGMVVAVSDRLPLADVGSKV